MDYITRRQWRILQGRIQDFGKVGEGGGGGGGGGGSNNYFISGGGAIPLPWQQEYLGER